MRRSKHLFLDLVDRAALVVWAHLTGLDYGEEGGVSLNSELADIVVRFD